MISDHGNPRLSRMKPVERKRDKKHQEKALLTCCAAKTVPTQPTNGTAVNQCRLRVV